ncbi:ParB/RepB/Spo0J family partition protein [Singulisphaera sp. PoT]|uniref:ParB/RepB/Spo0J family partition protein n=1 Tax=Singulisphaera sp. PoT TaxID=3411797 RepID=UPI003BF46F6C
MTGRLPDVTNEPVSRFADHPENARKHCDLDSLLPSIERDGILQPIGAIELPDDWLGPIWGNRRLGCARILGLATVPTRVFRGPIRAGDVERLALTENLARLGLRPSEEARGLHAAMTSGRLTGTELATLFGFSDAKVSRKLALLKLVEPLVALIDGGTIPESAAPDLARLGEAEQLLLAESTTGPVGRDELKRALGRRPAGRKAPKQHRLRRGRLSVVSASEDLSELLGELEEMKKSVRKALDQGWDFPTLARVLAVSAQP